MLVRPKNPHELWVIHSAACPYPTEKDNKASNFSKKKYDLI